MADPGLMTDTGAGPADHEVELVRRSAVFALLARLLGEDPGPLVAGDDRARLEALLHELGEDTIAAHVSRLDSFGALDGDQLGMAWVHWFDQGRVPPYECSNTVMSAGGHTAPMADIAGFYRAFGMKVHGDRPDHVVAELEFASLVTLVEAQARHDGDLEHADVAANAARAFLRDHLGRWLDPFAARLRAIDPPVPWAPLATAAAAFVASEARRHNVIVVETAPIFPAEPDPPYFDNPLDCGDG